MKSIITVFVCAAVVSLVNGLTIHVNLDLSDTSLNFTEIVHSPDGDSGKSGVDTTTIDLHDQQDFSDTEDFSIWQDFDELQRLENLQDFGDQTPISLTKVTGIEGGWVCHGEKLNPNTLEKTVEQGLHASFAPVCKKGKNNAKDCYPHVFKNYNSFPFPECVKDAAKTLEFPIMRGSLYNGGPPGMDRVIFIPKSDQKAVFCGVITHVDADENGFTKCWRGNGK